MKTTRGKLFSCFVLAVQMIFFVGCSANHYYLRGTTYALQENYDLAITEFTKAIELDSNDYRYYKERAGAYYHKGDYDNAIADYTKAIKLCPQDNPDWIIYAARADAYIKKGDYRNAIADIEKKVVIYSKVFENENYEGRESVTSMVYSGYIEKALEEQNYDAVIDGYSLLIKLEPDVLSHYEARIDAYYKKGNITAAGKDIDYFIGLCTQRITTEPDSKTLDALLSRAKMFAYKKNRTRAYADINRARQICSYLTKDTSPPGDDKANVVKQFIKEMMTMAAIGKVDDRIQDIVNLLEGY